MSHLYKEWRDIVREYIERDSKINPYKYDPKSKLTEFTKPSWHNQSTASRSKQSEKQNDK
jgi:hypothetical protein